MSPHHSVDEGFAPKLLGDACALWMLFNCVHKLMSYSLEADVKWLQWSGELYWVYSCRCECLPHTVYSGVYWYCPYVCSQRQQDWHSDIDTVYFWENVCKTVRPILSDRCLVCPSCMFVCDVGVLSSNGWTDEDETWHGGRPRPRSQCARWGPNSPKRGTAPLPIFSPCLLWPNSWID